MCLAWGGWDRGESFSALRLLGFEQAHEVACRGVEQHHEALRGGHERSEQHAARLVLARQGRQLVLDGLRVEHLTVEEPSFDLELLVVLDEGLDETFPASDPVAVRIGR